MIAIPSEKILVVDDDQQIRELIEVYLKNSGFQVLTSEGGTTVSRLITDHSPDLIILDVMMPDQNGFEVCQSIRQLTDVPILFLSAKESDFDKIIGFGVGGDDYITKPFSPAVLVARVKAHLRRNKSLLYKKAVTAHDEEKQILKFPNLEIDLHRYTVRVNDSTITLPAKQFQLLSLLARHPNQVFSVQQLFNAIWGTDSLGDYRTVMVHISHLRKKIEPEQSSPKYIATMRGIGYKFIFPPEV